MEDSKIIELYWLRNEQAITETELKYGKLCKLIANNILSNLEDVEEAAEFLKQKNKKRWLIKVAAIAACFCTIVVITAIMIMNSNQVVAKQSVMDKGEYYIVYELYRNFGYEQNKELKKQYQYVVFNGVSVLASGISLEKPKVEYISDSIVKVQYEYAGKKEMIYCDLRTKKHSYKIESDTVLLEWDERIAYLEDSDAEKAVIITSVAGEKYDDIYEYVDINENVTDIKVSVNDEKNQATITYVTSKGVEKKKTVDLCSVKSKNIDIIKNTSQIKCYWKNELIEETEDYYIYDVSLVTNRKVYNNENIQYQYFVKSQGKIIDEGCAINEYPPIFEKIDNRILRLCSYTVKYFDVENGRVSPEYTDAIYDWIDGVAYYGEWPNNYIIACDMFTGEEINSKYTLLDVGLEKDEKKLKIVYKDDNEEKKLSINIIGNSDKICDYYDVRKDTKSMDNDVVKMYDVGRTDIVGQNIYQYFIYNKEKTEIVEVNAHYRYIPEIKKISEDIVKSRKFYGSGLWYCTYINQKNGQISEDIDGALFEIGNKVVNLKYTDSNIYVNIFDMFGSVNDGQTYLLAEDYFFLYSSVEVQIKDEKLIIKYPDSNYDTTEKVIELE